MAAAEEVLWPGAEQQLKTPGSAPTQYWAVIIVPHAASGPVAAVVVLV